MHKNEIGPISHTIYRNERPKTIKLQQENKGGTLFDNSLSISGIPGSHGNSMSNILRSLHTLSSGCIILHSNQQCTRVPISPFPYQHLFPISMLSRNRGGMGALVLWV